MEEQANQHEPVRDPTHETPANQAPELLTVSQAYDYLISEGLPRSKKTIRKWCRSNHVDKKEIAVPGGAKWLITRNSLDARIAEERLIDASLMQETGTNGSDQGRTDTGADGFAPVRNDPLVDLLKEQLAHERHARLAAEAQNRELVDKYHEISIASAQMGMEIGKGMQEQARTRRLAVFSETGSNQPIEPRIRRIDEPRQDGPRDAGDPGDGGDNPGAGSGNHPV